MAPCAVSVKGTLLLSRLKYLRSKEQEDVGRVLQRLSADDLAILNGILLPSSWYPADLVHRLEQAIVEVLAQGDRSELFVDMGRASATMNLTGRGTQRAYVQLGDPHFVLRYSPHVYASTHSTGSRTYQKTGETSALLRTTDDVAEPNAEDCLTTVGWLTRAIELSGGQEARTIETQCRARGAAQCEYHCEWRLVV